VALGSNAGRAAVEGIDHRGGAARSAAAPAATPEPRDGISGQTTTSPGKIKLHRLDKWPVIRAEQTGYDLACRIVHASMGSGKTVS